MMGMMDDWADEIPDFKEYLHHQFNDNKQRKVAESDSWAVPLKEVRRELFSPSDQDNKDSTPLLETLAKIACQAWIKELLDPRKKTLQYLSVSGSKYCWQNCPEEAKKALLGALAVNDLAESSFAGLTAQLQFFGRLGLASAAAVSDMARNKFLSRAKPEANDGNTGLFHQLPGELQVTALMCAIEFAPDTRESNNAALQAQDAANQARKELRKQEKFANATDEYIECLIHHTLWGSERCWKTKKEVKDGLRSLEYKTDKYAALKDNFMIRFLGFGWKDFDVTMSKDGRKKPIPVVQKTLNDLIEKSKDWPIPSKPPTKIPRRKNTSVLGTMTTFQKNRDDIKDEEIDNHDQECRREWRDREAAGKGDILSDMNRVGKKRKIDSSFVEKKIEVYTKFDTFGPDGKTVTGHAMRWCSALVKEVSDGTWAKIGKNDKRLKTKHKEGEAADVIWDEVPEVGLGKCRQIIELQPSKWNGTVEKAWRWYHADFNYGIKD